jgi:hypothetical protein
METEPERTTADDAGAEPADPGEEHHGLIETMVERMRGTGVGTEDPNIIGDAGPTDVPPGRDPDSPWPPPPAENPEAPA